jgi:transposase InsO family protein
VSRFRFISDHRAVYGVKRLCRVLDVSRSGFYAWLAGAGGRAARAAQEERLVTQIRQIHADTYGTYGSPGSPSGCVPSASGSATSGWSGSCASTRSSGATCAAGTPPPAVTRPRRPPRTCWAATSPPSGPTVDGWVTSPTCGSLTASFTWPPCWTCTHAGWSAGRLVDHARAELVCDALQAAVATRGGNVRSVLFHTDHGTQYTAGAFAGLCDHHGVVQSMGRIGDSLDNAVAESFFATLKRELGARWDSVEQARLAVFSWIAFYNHHRRHSTLGYHSPIDYERITAHQQPEAA